MLNKLFLSHGQMVLNNVAAKSLLQSFVEIKGRSGIRGFNGF